MFCHNCGQEIVKESNFCKFCGARVSSDLKETQPGEKTIPPAPPVPPETKHRESYNGWLILVVIGLFLATAL